MEYRTPNNMFPQQQEQQPQPHQSPPSFQSSPSSNKPIIQVVISQLRELPNDILQILSDIKYCLFDTYMYDVLLRLICLALFGVLLGKYVIPGIKRWIWPPTAEELYQEGLILQRQGDSSHRAIPRFQSCLARDPRHGLAYVALAKEQLHQQHYHSSLDTIRRGLDCLLTQHQRGVVDDVGGCAEDEDGEVNAADEMMMEALIPPTGGGEQALVGPRRRRGMGVRERNNASNLASPSLQQQQPRPPGASPKSSQQFQSLSSSSSQERVVIQQLQTMQLEAEALSRYGTNGVLAKQLNVGNFTSLDGCRS